MIQAKDNNKFSEFMDNLVTKSLKLHPKRKETVSPNKAEFTFSRLNSVPDGGTPDDFSIVN
jgi:hypothetical protein